MTLKYLLSIMGANILFASIAYANGVKDNTQDNINIQPDSNCELLALSNPQEETPSKPKSRILQRRDSIMRAQGKTPPSVNTAPQKQENERYTVIDGHPAVDLGLSVLWAADNIGAKNMIDAGDYFAWGEIEKIGTHLTPNKRYTEYVGKDVTLGDISQSEYDIAHKLWGGNWRMPNLEEARELVEKCKWEWMTVGGVNGYKITGPNGKFIFMPSVGYIENTEKKENNKLGSYWTSTRKIKDGTEAFILTFIKDPSIKNNWVIGTYPRSAGLPIRPVTGYGIHDNDDFLNTVSGNKNGHDYVDLGLSVKWATSNIGANNPEDYGEYYSRGESRNKPKRYFTEGDYSLENVNMTKEVGELSGSKYDVATKKWGEEWRTPTKEEALELINKCKWEPVLIRGHYGVKVTGPNGNSIFLPSSADGPFVPGTNKYIENFGSYWTTGTTEYFNEGIALNFYTLSDKRELNKLRGWTGLTIRPVTK